MPSYEWGLVLSAFFMGLTGSGHCAAMCGPLCAAMQTTSCYSRIRYQGKRPHYPYTFMVFRLVSYTLGGSLVASGMSLLLQQGGWSTILRPLWAIAHAAALGLGIWLLWYGQQPAWFSSWKAKPSRFKSQWLGLTWVALPCGLLQSSLMLAALSPSAASGASVMAAFALASSPVLLIGPTLWQRLSQSPTTWLKTILTETSAIRLSGLMLFIASGWALGHGIWQQFRAMC